MAAAAGLPIQDFCARQDSGCGSTIGPIVATRLGIRTVDVGLPQLSMHSAREVRARSRATHARQPRPPPGRLLTQHPHAKMYQ